MLYNTELLNIYLHNDVKNKIKRCIRHEHHEQKYAKVVGVVSYGISCQRPVAKVTDQE